MHVRGEVEADCVVLLDAVLEVVAMADGVVGHILGHERRVGAMDGHAAVVRSMN